MTKNILLKHAKLFKANDDSLIDDGTILIEGNIIRYSGPTKDFKNDSTNFFPVDLNGQFVMPGMTESHAHLSYSNNGPTELEKTPVEEAMLNSMDNARIMLGSGFTSAIGFGSVHRIDVFLRDAIKNGQIPGPRLKASGRDLGSTGSNADLTPDYARPDVDGLGMFCDGPYEVRRGVRSMAKNRVDVVKIFLDGECMCDHAQPGQLTYTDEEVAAAVDEAHKRNMKVATHSRSAAAVKQAVIHGVDYIGHANYLDEEALDLLKKNKDRVFVGPAIAWELKFMEDPSCLGFTPTQKQIDAYAQEVEATVSSVKKMKSVGVRVLVGGDYGLNVTPHGTYAKDLEYFVRIFGMTPSEALLCATRDGGAAFDSSGMLGTLEEGKLADLLVINGNPLEDITVLQDHDRLTAVIKDGIVYQNLVGKSPYVQTDFAKLSEEAKTLTRKTSKEKPFLEKVI